jgi:hypothetical protein
MRVLLLQLDGAFPNLALMRISAHHKSLGDVVRFKACGNESALWRVGPTDYDKVYAGLLFSRSKPLAEQLLSICPTAILGGSGWDDIQVTQDLISVQSRRSASKVTKLEDFGITTTVKDYSIYPSFKRSIGFTQRGCRMQCGFCDVPVREGKVTPSESITQIWRGTPYPKELIIWDNDTFGNPDWRSTFRAIHDGGFKVSFNQGVNVRLMNEENAEWLANTPCYAADFTRKCWYTAWDNKDDEEILFRGLRRLVKYGVKPYQITVYMLIGFWAGETAKDREYRRRKLRDFGVIPYPMPFVRTKELVGFQRWIVSGAYDKWVPWYQWKEAGYQPAKLGIV